MSDDPSHSLTQPPPLPMAAEMVYFNGFGIALSAGDVMINLVRNGIPVLTVNGSYTVVKSLADGLAKAVSELEIMMGRKIMTVDEISSAMIARNPPQK